MKKYTCKRSGRVIAGVCNDLNQYFGNAGHAEEYISASVD